MEANTASRLDFRALNGISNFVFRNFVSFKQNFSASALKSLETTLYKIGEPKISLVNTLQSNEIWLEGAEVKQSDYPNLYALWGNTYGTAAQAGYFKLFGLW